MEEAIAQLTSVLKNLQTQQTVRDAPQPADLRGIQLQPFDEEQESFDTYIERLENYLELRNLGGNTPDNDSKRVQILISCLGPRHYQLLTNLTSPDLPKTKEYFELITLLKGHLCPAPNEVAEQHKFALRVQHEGESISSYQAELKRLTKNCKFVCESCKASTINTHLRSQFIRGVCDRDIREKLLQQSSKISFDDAVRIAQSIESSKKESNEICPNVASVHSVGRNNAQGFTNYKKQDAPASGKYRHLLGRCFKCGGTNHRANVCKCKNLKCTKCGKIGHIEKVCLSDVSQVKVAANQNQLEESRSADINLAESEDLTNEENVFTINRIKESVTDISDKILIQLEINGKKCNFEVDTGAALSTLSLGVFRQLCPNQELEETNIKLKTYTGEIIKPLGTCTLQIKYKDQFFYGRIYVIEKNVDAIFGRDWLKKIKLNWAEICKIEVFSDETYKHKLESLFEEHSDLFKSGIGKIPGFNCSLKIVENAVPVFCKPRPVPYALKELIDEEIDRLENLDIIEKVTHSDWGSPIVPVVKSTGKIRICADYKTTVNKFLKNDNYPIPRIQDLFAKMSGGKWFCTLDVCQAYLHMEVDHASSLLQAISTHKGTYRVKRMMFGIKVAPNTWQRFMDQVLIDVPGTICFFDDILVQGSTRDELLNNLRIVFTRLNKYKLHLNKDKCKFFLNRIAYLGHIIDKDGLRPMVDKVEAIMKTPRPRNVSELRQVLGLINYYQKFIPNLAAKLNPLNHLLRKDVLFEWTTECEVALQNLKKEITGANVLVHYNPKLPLLLATDASPVGLGAVISHIMPDGSERPIAFASRSLSLAEKNYSQLDKEATGIVWGLRKFFQYCYGRKITLITDSEPLTRILHPEKDLPATSAVRLLHYAQFMAGFNYNIQYRNTKHHANVDYLSRSPLTVIRDESKLCAHSIFNLNQANNLPVTRNEIKQETLKDPECRQIYQALQSGEGLTDEEFTKFSLEDGCIYNGVRVVIPKSLRGRIIEELHTAHTGIVRMKNLARSYVWWKGIDRDLEEETGKCKSCCKNRNNPTQSLPSHPWEYPRQPWQRLHIDYAGPFFENYFLIIVDAYSKYIEIFRVKSMTSRNTIAKLRETFARFGLPITVVSDNGTNFRSQEMKEFFKSNGIHHKFSAPYHPATNGQAERCVQSFKASIRKMVNEPGDLDLKIQRFLMQYKKTPNTTTGQSPAEILLKTNFRTRLDLIKRNLPEEQDSKIPLQVCSREFRVGDSVQVRFYNNASEKWKFGKIARRVGLLHYLVEVDGVLHERHVNQILKTSGNHTNYKNDTQLAYVSPKHSEIPSQSEQHLQQQQPPPGEEREPTADTTETETEEQQTQGSTIDRGTENIPVLRRSTRIRRTPQRLNL